MATAADRPSRARQPSNVPAAARSPRATRSLQRRRTHRVAVDRRSRDGSGRRSTRSKPSRLATLAADGGDHLGEMVRRQHLVEVPGPVDGEEALGSARPAGPAAAKRHSGRATQIGIGLTGARGRSPRRASQAPSRLTSRPPTSAHQVETSSRRSPRETSGQGPKASYRSARRGRRRGSGGRPRAGSGRSSGAPVPRAAGAPPG